MKRALDLVWRFKWIPLFTVIIEASLIFPFIFLLNQFGERSFTYNLNATPMGSPEFVSMMVESVVNDASFISAFKLFMVIAVIAFIVKLALVAGTYAVLHHDKPRIRDWLSAAGEYLLKTIGLFLRWLLIPIIIVSLWALLLVPDISWLSIIAFIMMGLGWLLSLSILNYAMIFSVRDEKKSLRKGYSVFKRNTVRTLGVIMIVIPLLLGINYVSTFLIQWTASPDFGSLVTVICAFLFALIMRFVILLWQSMHMKVFEDDQQPVY
ncbi:hypothetical protein [Pleionea sediminis]|uniref:hypothetical protein n=1 Tax=Pleionea sediminis TaxID=2569479 RepID=UPI0011867568|nr:hypothetical protein [Pleionea sediminis]